MTPAQVAVIGGVGGLVVGVLLLPDIAAAPLFAAMVGAFIGFEATWALREMTRMPGKQDTAAEDEAEPDGRGDGETGRRGRDRWRTLLTRPYLWFVPALVALCGLAPLAPVYDLLFRLVICAGAALIAVTCRDAPLPRYWFYGMIAVAMLYNPLIFIGLAFWWPVALATAGFFAAHYVMRRRAAEARPETGPAP